MTDSIWATVSLPSFPRLEGDIKKDVLIIGGGLAGILCAYHLAQVGVDYALIEADRICHGVTRNTTAKISSQHALMTSSMVAAMILSDLIQEKEPGNQCRTLLYFNNFYFRIIHPLQLPQTLLQSQRKASQ